MTVLKHFVYLCKAERDGGPERGSAGPGGGGAGAAPFENPAGHHHAQDGQCARDAVHKP